MKAKSYNPEVPPYLRILYPGSEIPKSFASPTEGSLVELELLPQWNSSLFLGFALCAITDEPNFHYYDRKIHCRCRFEDIYGDTDEPNFVALCSTVLYTFMCCSVRFEDLWECNHVVIWYDYIFYQELEKRRHWFSEDYNYTVSFEFFGLDGDLNEQRVVKNCGVLPLYADDDGSGELEATSIRQYTEKRDFYEYCEAHQMEYLLESIL